MTVFDVRRGYVAMFTDAAYDEDSDTWSALRSVAYLGSNGLSALLKQSNDPRNRGTHRGNNGAVASVRWDEVQNGSIDHVLKIAVGPDREPVRLPDDGLRTALRYDRPGRASATAVSGSSLTIDLESLGSIR